VIDHADDPKTNKHQRQEDRLLREVHAVNGDPGFSLEGGVGLVATGVDGQHHSIPDLPLLESLEALVDLLKRDDLDLRPNIVLAAEDQHLLDFRRGSCKRPHQIEVPYELPRRDLNVSGWESS